MRGKTLLRLRINKLHRRRKVKNIGAGPRFRILGGGGAGQIASRHMTSY